MHVVRCHSEKRFDQICDIRFPMVGFKSVSEQNERLTVVGSRL